MCVRLGHRRSRAWKIECQPRKRCHNIPRVCNAESLVSIASPVSLFSLLFAPVACFREYDRVGGIGIHSRRSVFTRSMRERERERVAPSNSK